ncbi:MAG: hypothetical protein NTW67_06055, partial [Candidatus Woesearchaeota archaeon]|nr:hypothetical protein [Candidatus Woesearchaeota archaeon]
AVLVTVNKTDGSLVSMKTLQFTGSTYNGILAVGSGNYLVYGYSHSYWGGTYRGFALTVSVSGDTYVINNRS